MLVFMSSREITETPTRELCHTHDEVMQWKSLGRFNKAYHSRDHAETLKSYQETIRTALEELQVGPEYISRIS